MLKAPYDTTLEAPLLWQATRAPTKLRRSDTLPVDLRMLARAHLGWPGRPAADDRIGGNLAAPLPAPWGYAGDSSAARAGRAFWDTSAGVPLAPSGSYSVVRLDATYLVGFDMTFIREEGRSRTRNCYVCGGTSVAVRAMGDGRELPTRLS